MFCFILAVSYTDPYSLDKRFITSKDFRVFEDVDYDENINFSVSFDIGNLGYCFIAENIAITYLDNQTFPIVIPQLENTSISRKEKVEILRKHSPTPLCETGRFVNRKKIKCFLHMRKGGRLIFISVSEKLLDISLEISGYYCSTRNYLILMSPAFTIAFFASLFLLEVFILGVWACCCKRHKQNNCIEISNDETENEYSEDSSIEYNRLTLKK